VGGYFLHFGFNFIGDGESFNNIIHHGFGWGENVAILIEDFI
jgi:hypothetical protein